jgi:hypothetical protein
LNLGILIISSIFGRVLVYKAGKTKQGVYVHKLRSINATTTITNYAGEIMTQAQYELASPERHAIAVQNSHDKWVVPVMTRMLNGTLVVPYENFGAHIATASGGERFNCVLRTALDGEVLVVAKHALNGGDQLLLQQD